MGLRHRLLHLLCVVYIERQREDSLAKALLEIANVLHLAGRCRNFVPAREGGLGPDPPETARCSCNKPGLHVSLPLSFSKVLRELLRRRYCAEIFSPFKIGNQSWTRRTPPQPLLRLHAGTSQVHTGEPRKPAEMPFCRFRRSRYHPHVQPAADRFSDV